jgi:putative transposase
VKSSQIQRAPLVGATRQRQRRRDAGADHRASAVPESQVYAVLDLNAHPLRSPTNLGSPNPLHRRRAGRRACVSDNGTELTSVAILKWSEASGVALHYTAPGRPQQNAFAESFIGRLRDEYLYETLFASLPHVPHRARHLARRQRPHSALASRTTEEFRTGTLPLRPTPAAAKTSTQDSTLDWVEVGLRSLAYASTGPFDRASEARRRYQRQTLGVRSRRSIAIQLGILVLQRVSRLCDPGQS